MLGANGGNPKVRQFLRICKTKLVSSTLRTVAVKRVYSPMRFV